MGDWAELAQSRLIYLQAPASELDPALARLNRAIGRWDNRILVLLDDDLDCGALRSAEAAGASVASLAHMQIGQSELAFVEGGAGAVSRLRSILGRTGVRVIHMQSGDKAVYSAGVNLGRLVSSALMDSVVRCLRKAGIDASTARKIAGWIADCSVAEVLTRGKTSTASRRIPVPLLEERQLEALCIRDARIGRFARQMTAAAAEFCGEQSDAPETAPVPNRRALAGRGKGVGI